MSAPLSQWLRSLAVAVPTATLSALLVSPSLAQNAPPKDPPAAAKEAKDEVRDAKKEVRDTQRDARDTVREGRENVRDTRQESREEIRDTRDKVRDPRDPKDPARDLSRDARDPENLKQPLREERRENRQEHGIGANVRFNAQGTRAADIGLWFERDSADKGLIISDVATKGAIAKLGFREGDRIISVNGNNVVRQDEFINYLFADDVRNDKIKVIVMRDGKEEVIIVEPAVFVDELSYVEHDPLETFGVIIDDRYTDRIVVLRVVPRSPAYYAGLRSGDVITGFNGQRLANIAGLVQRLTGADAGEVPVTITRGQANRTLHVDVPKFVNRTERRAALRPNFDNAVERREDRIDRRDDRIDDRRERREEAPRLPNNTAPAVTPAPVAPPAVAPPTVTPPSAPGNSPPARPGLFPRNK
ncbi:PDZ domain-containing protein [Anatilimnocola floriformis]|uniref:PDZ domain-containing protein n=1 Tax=Anatilimnocola floriformis TaxID=2948575 RepID=UPI0020C376BE|nr:PDZ domain-containing protein [Anatilimnocola floriformis]